MKKFLLAAELLHCAIDARAADDDRPPLPTMQERKRAAHDFCLKDVHRDLADAPFVRNAKTASDREMALRLIAAAAVDHCWEMRPR